jgi:peptide/nickel transport system substrate-binding protein
LARSAGYEKESVIVNRRLGALCAITIVAGLAAAGCGEQKKPAGAPVSGTEGSGPARTFTYADNNEIMVGWDPASSYSNENIAMSNMYEQLVRYDSTAKKVEPLLAESWESERGGKRWTFKLRQGVTFHTGRPLDAAAAKAALDRTIKLNEGAAYEWGAVEEITAPEPTTLVFDLSYAAPLDLIASSGYAAYIYDVKAAPAKRLEDWFGEGNAAGTGPYTVEEWNKGAETELRLTRFEDYWRGWDGPHYQRVVFRHVPRDTTAAQLLEAGDVTFVSRLAPQLWERVKGVRGIKASTTPSFQNLLAMLNTESGPLADVRVRKAVAAAMDYEGLLSALKGAGQQAHGVIPEGLLGYDPSLTASQDLDAAKAQLAAAGYGPGKKPLTLQLTHAEGDDDQALMASILKSNLAELGVKLDVRPMQWTSQWDKGKSEDPAKRQDIFVFYWYPDYADPFSWFSSLFHSAEPPYFNLAYYDNPEFDKQVDALQELTATDRDKAAASYQELQRTLIDDAVAPVLYVQNSLRAYRDEFSGYVDNPAYSNVVFAYDIEPTG